ncbi:MAG: 3-phosphoshikimate 1-carboxyvinyltransferase [Pseudomonadota bacterium]|nr:3-phosphoshikimate 1-carboxyvinyltransferase [Gammaproteobacteria bacterium]MDQ3583560.1 3-phosphoshikimate 1-carboxyvinyltransferase [Pseudomonadota bacterium]
MSRLIIEGGGRLRGRVRVPGDKSISHRVLMLGAIAEGVTEVEGFLEGADTLATLAAFRSLGVAVEHAEPGRLRIEGRGLRGLHAPPGPLDLGNSGTSMRLLAGLLAGQPFDTILTGDASLTRRPMRRVITPLERMGGAILCTSEGTAPLVIRGGRSLRGIDYDLPIASAQVKSALLLAGLYAEGPTRLREPAGSRDHTERMLRRFGATIATEGGVVRLTPGTPLEATRVDVPADLSSAAFFLVGAAMKPGSDLVIDHAGVNPTRTGVLDLLRLMGADIEVLEAHSSSWADEGGEPVADVRVRGGALRGVEIPERLVPLAIDEFPALFIAAAAARGETVLCGAEELRHKESDRIETMARGLRTLGIEARPTADGIVIRGGALQGGVVDSASDHRVAMAFAMAGLAVHGSIEVADCDNIATSFPGFVEAAQRAGLRVRWA